MNMLSPMKMSSLQIDDEDGTNSSFSSPGLFLLVVSGIVAKNRKYASNDLWENELIQFFDWLVGQRLTPHRNCDFRKGLIGPEIEH